MHPILFHIGSYPVRAYSLAIFLALLGATTLATWLARKRGVAWAQHYADFMAWGLLGGVIGARLWEVAFNWNYFATALHKIPAVWEGGLSIQGGIFGGMAAAFIYTGWHKIPFGRFADGAVPGILFGQAIGRLLGCSLNGDAYGKPTGTSFGLVHVPGTIAHEHFGSVPLWPAEVFEGVFDLCLMAYFIRRGLNQGAPGNHLLLYGVLYSIGRFALEFLRADTERMWAGLTPPQLGSLGICAVCTALLLVRRLSSSSTRTQPLG
jgi:phosphatidylglycerol:prolipoprotein diacylglycerol transferase